MRLLIINLVSVAILVAGAMTANAAVISFQNLQALGGADLNALNAGDRIQVEMFLDTEGATNISSVFLSTMHDPDLLVFVENPDSFSPGAILFNTSTFEGVSRAAQPQTSTLDVDGRVRAASFASATASGVASANQLLSTLVFEAVQGPGGTTTISNPQLAGDLIAFDNVAGAFTSATDTPSFTVVPEPATILLSLASLGTVGLVSRRRWASR